MGRDCKANGQCAGVSVRREGSQFFGVFRKNRTHRWALGREIVKKV